MPPQIPTVRFDRGISHRRHPHHSASDDRPRDASAGQASKVPGAVPMSVHAAILSRKTSAG
jgi:hypothetical protein